MTTDDQVLNFVLSKQQTTRVEVRQATGLAPEVVTDSLRHLCLIGKIKSKSNVYYAPWVEIKQKKQECRRDVATTDPWGRVVKATHRACEIW